MTKKKPPKPKPLNAKQKNFCKYYVGGMNQQDAYAKAYKIPKTSARRLASVLRTKLDIETEITRLQKISDDKACLTLLEKRKFLALVVRTPISMLAASSLLTEKHETKRITYGWGKDKEVHVTEKLHMMSKAKAIELDNRMTGDDAPIEVKITAGESLIDILKKRQTAKA